jgi:hypothetical protein
MDFLDLAVRRRCGCVNFHREIVEEASAAEQSDDREIRRKACHRLEGIPEHENLDLVKVKQPGRPTRDTLQVVLNAIFQAMNTQRVTDASVKNAGIGARIDPASERFRRRRIATA